MFPPPDVSVEVQMCASSKAKRESTAAVAEAGLILTDLSLKPLAIDSGVLTILSDLNLDAGAESNVSIPREIANVLRDWPFDGASRLPILLQGLRYSYHCHAYRIEPHHDSTVPPMIAIHVQKGPSTANAIDKIAKVCNLTDREMEVLRGVSMGLTSKEIAARMEISPNTVKSYIRLLMVKIGVTTRSGIVGKLLDHFTESND